MRSVSSKMYRMKQCALRPRPARPAPPSPAACFRDLHLETRASAASRERDSDRRPGRPSKEAEPGPGRGRAAAALGCGGGAKAAGTGRPGSGEKEVRIGARPAPLRLPWRGELLASTIEGVSGRFLRAHLLQRLRATSQLSKCLPAFLLTGSQIENNLKPFSCL